MFITLQVNFEWMSHNQISTWYQSLSIKPPTIYIHAPSLIVMNAPNPIVVGVKGVLRKPKY